MSIKTTTALLMIAVVSLALEADQPIDNKLAAKAEIVVRARRISFDGADKYARYQVRVLEVFKNMPGAKFTKELSVAAFSGKDGVSEGESTLYLERYSRNDINPVLWKLVGSEAFTGVSHVRNFE